MAAGRSCVAERGTSASCFLESSPVLLCNKMHQVIEGPSVGQQEPVTTSHLSPAPGKETQEVTGNGTARQWLGAEGQ